MECGKIMPWEHYPKFLRFNEVQNPLNVIIDFFSSGRPKNHRKELKVFRHYVTSDEHYKGDRHGPGTLLFQYDNLVKFMEAIHLLLCEYQEAAWQYKNVPNEEILIEEESWDYFPKNLSYDELENPYLAIKKCFKKLKPQHYRYHLQEWLHSALYNNPITEDMTAGDVIEVYENLVKLLSAGWLIHQRKTKETYYNDAWKARQKSKPTETKIVIDGLSPLKSMTANLTPAEMLGLGEISNLIISRIPCVKMINCIGTRDNSTIYYLVVAIDDHERNPEHQIANKIEDHCRFLAQVFVFVIKTSSMRNGINAGKRFWNTVILRGTQIYVDDKIELPPPTPVSDKIWLDRAIHDWQRWGVQGKQFLEGANFYMKEKNNVLALFMLHQAVESTLLAVIKAFSGYRPSAHNLIRIFKISMLFTQDIAGVFDCKNESDAKLFSILQTGYSDARYKNDFSVDETVLPLLNEKVNRLLTITEQLYTQFVTDLEQKILLEPNDTSQQVIG
jgi:HEPN domain-containing protein